MKVPVVLRGGGHQIPLERRIIWHLNKSRENGEIPVTDVYALGMIVYEMLTGTLPFHGDNALSVMNQHLTAIPASPRKFQPSIPPV